jgi:DNA end-binding protein Ku
MAARSQWKGFLNLNLVSVPVKAYSASSSGAGEVSLNQLHGECNSRIKYKKTCPIHGEVPNDQIVSGYEYSKDQYVIVDTEELNKLRTEDDKAIRIDSFIPSDAFDPLYLTGKNYYLVPEGPVGQKAYQVIYKGMEEADRYAIAQVVMHNKEQLVVVRPQEGLLVMSTLNYSAQVTSPSTFEEEAPKTPIAPEELQLVKTLIKASSSDKFDLSKFKDLYTEKLTQLIEAKVAGQELVAPPVKEQAQVINLMDALRESVARMQGTAPAAGAAAKKTAGKPPRKMAPSKGAKTAQEKKKKTS